jgi:HEAT repeat protein
MSLRRLLCVACGLLLIAAVGRADDPLPGLLKQLKDGETLERQDAAKEIGRLGPRAEEAIPALTAALRGRRVALPAARALARVGPKGVDALVEALTDSHAFKQAAADALAEQGRDVVPALVRALRSDDVKRRAEAIDVLAQIGPDAAEAVPALADVLAEPTVSFWITPGKPQNSDLTDGELHPWVPARWEWWDDNDPENVHFRAAYALECIGTAAVPAVVAALGDRQPPRPRAVRGAVASLGPALVRFLERKNNRHVIVDSFALAATLPEALEAALQSPSRVGRRCVCRRVAHGDLHPGAAVPALVRLLKDDDPQLRAAAAEALAAVGPDAVDAVPDLIEALHDPYGRSTFFGRAGGSPPVSGVRPAAVAALRAIGPKGKEALAEKGVVILKQALEKEDHDSWGHTSMSLGMIGPEAREAAPAIVDGYLAAKGDGCEVRRALRLLGADAAPALKKMLETSEYAGDALEAVAAGGPDFKGLLPEVKKALHSEDSAVRASALAALTGIDGDGRAAAPALIEALRDTDGGVRLRAARLLRVLGRRAKEAVPALRKALDDASGDVVCEAALALLRAGADDKESLDRLVERLADDDAYESATHALAALGPKAKGAAPALKRLLSADKTAVRLRAAFVLGALGREEAKPAAQALLKVLDDRDQDVWVLDRALRQLVCVGPPGKEALPTLLRLFRDERGPANLSGRAFAVMAAMGPDARDALPVVWDAYKENQTPSAAYFLGAVGTAAPEAVPRLMTLLLDPDGQYARPAAAEALGRVGPPAADAVPRLKDALHDCQLRVRVWAAFALIRITGESKPYLPLIISALRDEPDAAAEALRRLGPAARSAIPALIKALDDDRAWVRGGAVRALGAFRADAKETVPALIALVGREEREALEAREWDYPPNASEAIALLGDFGPAAKEALPLLRRLATGGAMSDLRLADDAVQALDKIDTPGGESP